MDDLTELANYLFANRAKGLPPRSLAEVFDRLIWCLSDIGEQMLRIQLEWLTSVEVDKVRIALEMNDAFPFDSQDQMDQVLTFISTKWPELKAKCDETAARWRHLRGRS